MVVFIRLAALTGITSLAGLLCMQDMTKKGVVLKNFTSSIREKSQISDPQATGSQLNKAKEPLADKFRRIKQEYNQAASIKSQKLVQDHMNFAAMSLAGSLCMPKSFMLLTLGYFMAYQLYYFNQGKASKKMGAGDRLLTGQQFHPIWQGFMAGGGAIMVLRALRVMRFF